ncbi:MAG: hypothetical protein ACYC3I_14680 [Gemmataceae bacterium]
MAARAFSRWKLPNASACSPERRRKIAEARRGNPRPPYALEAMHDARRGSRYTEEARRPDDDLMVVTHADFDNQGLSIEELRTKLQWCRKLLRGLVRANEDCRAASWSVVLDPPRSGDKSSSVRCRLLMLFPHPAPALLVPTLPGWKTWRVGRPTETELQKLVAWACAYPIGMLRGSPEAVQEALWARKELRLAEISGAFRKVSSEGLLTEKNCNSFSGLLACYLIAGEKKTFPSLLRGGPTDVGTKTVGSVCTPLPLALLSFRLLPAQQEKPVRIAGIGPAGPIVKLHSGFQFAEGPAADRRG